ncbi:MAG: alpha/beta hydrolase, partial [Gammaproteobacteria bacterium]|nr:alpha/beta hydrolase [Gammaproteobacteria bacterium]
MRAMIDAMTAAIQAEAPPVEDVVCEDVYAAGIDGDPDARCRVYRPEGTDAPLPALLWMHGGGFVLGSIEFDDLMAAQFAKDTGTAIVSVEYRLAPEHPFPAAVNDCYAVLR